MDTLNTVQSCTTVQSSPGLRYLPNLKMEVFTQFSESAKFDYEAYQSFQQPVEFFQFHYELDI